MLISILILILLGLLLNTVIGVVFGFELYFIYQEQKRMSEKQDQFDQKISAANEKLDAISTDLAKVPEAISSEADEIKRFIEENEDEVDTSALDGVVERLNNLSESTSTLATNIGGIFTAPETANTESETSAPVEGEPNATPFTESEATTQEFPAASSDESDE